MRNPMFRCVSRFRCPESKNRTNREWISNSDKEMPLKWSETCLQSILLSNIGQYTQKAISRVRSALKCVFRVVRQIHDKTVRKYTPDNKLKQNSSQKLHRCSMMTVSSIPMTMITSMMIVPVLDDNTRVQGRIKFTIKRCTDNDDQQMPFKRAERGLWRDLSTWQGDYTQNK